MPRPTLDYALSKPHTLCNCDILKEYIYMNDVYKKNVDSQKRTHTI